MDMYVWIPYVRNMIDIDVSVCPQDNSETVYDRIVVQTDVGDISVPITLKALLPQIEAPTAFNFGHIVVGASASKMMELRNVGPKDGTFEVLEDPDSPFTVSCRHKTLQPPLLSIYS